MNRLFTSESVTEGHPDKVCDQISDAVLDAILAKDKDARVACECCCTESFLLIMGEITTTAKVDVEKVARDTIRKIGSNDRLVGALKLCEKHGLDAQFVCIGIAACMMFDPDGDDNSKEVCAYAKENGAKAALEKYAAYDGAYTELIVKLYGMLKCGKQISALVKLCEETTAKEIRV